MTRFAVACSTFLFGISAAVFFQCETEVRPVAAVSEPQIFTCFIEQKTIKPEPFFKSFAKDEYYSGWLIADEFPGMKEVWTILLRHDEEKGKGHLWSAMVLTSNPDDSANDDDNFESIPIKTDSDHLSFSTNKIRGIQYRFDGKFFKQDKNFYEGEKVLNGTMQKIVRGKVVAKFSADFAYHEPVCFH